MPGVHGLEDSAWLSPASAHEAIGRRPCATPRPVPAQAQFRNHTPCFVISQPMARRRRLQRRCESNDPEFVAKAADVVGLYVDPTAKGDCSLCRRKAFDPSLGAGARLFEAAERARRETPQSPFSFHPDPVVVAQSDRNLVFHPARPITERPLPSPPSSICRSTSRLSSQHTTRPPSHSHGPRKKVCQRRFKKSPYHSTLIPSAGGV
jgi:hypothetical protein